MLELDDRTGDKVALIEVGDGAVDELVHLLVGHVVQGEDGRVLNLTQKWTPFGNGAPVVMVAAVGVLDVRPSRRLETTCLGGL